MDIISRVSLPQTITYLLLSIALVACSQKSPDPQQLPGSPPNFIVLIGDDMGVETLDCYQIGSNTAVTPNLNTLCDEGIRFDNFWAQAVCSPTRATILSGRYGFRNGVGTPATSGIERLPVPEKTAGAHKELRGGGPAPGDSSRPEANPGLRVEAFTLPMALKAAAALNYETAAFGKWHLSDANNGGIDHPNLAGFDHYAGSVRTGGVESYFAWSNVTNGEVTAGKTGWADSAKVDDAINWLDQRDGKAPWLMWVAFNAPHTPFHLPPIHLLHSDTRNLDPDAISTDNQHDYYNAMIEAMDTEIGRLLANLNEDQRANTYVLFVADNGTPEQVALAPFDYDHSKGSLYQGGINVPFIMTGPGIEAGRITAALANSVDVYATLLDLAGINIDAVVPRDKVYDTVSLAPVLMGETDNVRDYAYADLFGRIPRGEVNEQAIRNQTHKLIMGEDRQQLFDLNADPYEQNDLLTRPLANVDAEQYDELKAQLTALITPAGDR